MNEEDRIRNAVLDLHRKAKMPHTGSALSCVEILLYIKNKMHPNDELIISKGHAVSAWYAINGVTDMENLPHHATRGYYTNVSTGSLGMGLSIGAGLALARPNDKIYVLMGDGELQEGQVYEAWNFIYQNRIENIEVHIDVNGFQACCPTMTSVCIPFNDFISSLVYCWKTVKGKGWKGMEDVLESHYAYPTA
jgi:transketolase